MAELVAQSDFNEVFQHEDDENMYDLTKLWSCTVDPQKKPPRDMMLEKGNTSCARRVIAANRLFRRDLVDVTIFPKFHCYDLHDGLAIGNIVASTTFNEQQSLQDDFDDLQ